MSTSLYETATPATAQPLLKHVALVAAVVAGLLSTAPVASAQTTYEASATGSKKAGKPNKPKPFNGSWAYTAGGPNGSRAPAPLTWTYSWEGVKVDGSKFPKCTTQMIDAAQSDSVCPGKSLIGEAPFTALLGPEGLPDTNVLCAGKMMRMYNAGKKTIAWYIQGPAVNCAGVAYLPPFEASVSTKKSKLASASKKKSKKASTSSVTVRFPDNITHPLPGIEGGLNDIETTFLKRTTKKKGKKIAYMESTGCKGDRDFTFVTIDSEGEHLNETTAGKCKK